MLDGFIASAILYHSSSCRNRKLMPTKKISPKKAKNAEQQLIPADSIDHRILLIRGQRVMLDSDLAALYGVATKVLNQAVKRNLQRFPEDFMFQLTEDET